MDTHMYKQVWLQCAYSDLQTARLLEGTYEASRDLKVSTATDIGVLTISCHNNMFQYFDNSIITWSTTLYYY